MSNTSSSNVTMALGWSDACQTKRLSGIVIRAVGCPADSQVYVTAEARDQNSLTVPSFGLNFFASLAECESVAPVGRGVFPLFMWGRQDRT